MRLNKLTPLLLAGLALAGCSMSRNTSVLQTPINIPLEKFQCEEVSPRPKGEVIMESEVARYINSLEFANKDCQTRLKELRVIIRCFNTPKCDMKTLIAFMDETDQVRNKKQ